MAATKITDLSATTTLGANDLFVVVTNPTNAPSTKKVKAGDVLSGLANLVVSPATTNAYGTVKIGTNLYLNGNNALSANITQPIITANSTTFGVVKIGENLYLNGNNALSANIGIANTGDIIFSNTYITTNANQDIRIVSSYDNIISLESENSVQLVHNPGGNSLSYVHVANAGIQHYVYSMQGSDEYWSVVDIDPYGSHSVYGWNGTYSYNYILETTNASTFAIKPSPYYNNRLGIEPSSDYDIHIYEVNTRAGIVLGKPEESFIGVYGPGGKDGGAGLEGNNIYIHTVGNSPICFETANGSYQWMLTSNGELSFPDGSMQTAAYQLVTVPTSSIGQSSDLMGMIAYSNSYIYYCTANYDGITNIWKRVAWSNDTW